MLDHKEFTSIQPWAVCRKAGGNVFRGKRLRWLPRVSYI